RTSAGAGRLTTAALQFGPSARCAAGCWCLSGTETCGCRGIPGGCVCLSSLRRLMRGMSAWRSVSGSNEFQRESMMMLRTLVVAAIGLLSMFPCVARERYAVQGEPCDGYPRLAIETMRGMCAVLV